MVLAAVVALPSSLRKVPNNDKLRLDNSSYHVKTEFTI